MSRIRRIFGGATYRKTKITLPPMPDTKEIYPDWMYAAEDLYELSSEEDFCVCKNFASI